MLPVVEDAEFVGAFEFPLLLVGPDEVGFGEGVGVGVLLLLELLGGSGVGVVEVLEELADDGVVELLIEVLHVVPKSVTKLVNGTSDVPVTCMVVRLVLPALIKAKSIKKS